VIDFAYQYRGNDDIICYKENLDLNCGSYPCGSNFLQVLESNAEQRNRMDAEDALFASETALERAAGTPDSAKLAKTIAANKAIGGVKLKRFNVELQKRREAEEALAKVWGTHGSEKLAKVITAHKTINVDLEPFIEELKKRKAAEMDDMLNVPWKKVKNELEKFDIVLWDADWFNEEGWTGLIPNFLEGQAHRYAVAFQKKAEVPGFHRQWWNTYKNFPDRIWIVVLDDGDAADKKVTNEVEAKLAWLEKSYADRTLN